MAPGTGTATYESDEEKTELYSPSPAIITTTTPPTTTDLDAAFAQIRKDLIGRLNPLSTPFGPKPLVCELGFLWCSQDHLTVMLPFESRLGLIRRYEWILIDC